MLTPRKPPPPPTEQDAAEIIFAREKLIKFQAIS